jgi:hypothetical protein
LINRSKEFWSLAVGVALVSGSLVTLEGASAESASFERVVSTTITDVAEVSKGLEAPLGASVQNVDSATMDYNNCVDTAADDEAARTECSEEFKGIVNAYNEVIGTLGDHLPELKESVDTGANTLQREVVNQFQTEVSVPDLLAQAQAAVKSREEGGESIRIVGAPVSGGNQTLSARLASIQRLVGGMNSEATSLSNTQQVIAHALDLKRSSETIESILRAIEIQRKNLVLSAALGTLEIPTAWINSLDQARSLILGDSTQTLRPRGIKGPKPVGGLSFGATGTISNNPMSATVEEIEDDGRQW